MTTWNLEPIDWLDELTRRHLLPGFSKHAVRHALDCDGYVAGGFARSLGAAILRGKGVLRPYGLSEMADASRGWRHFSRYILTPPRGTAYDSSLDAKRLFKTHMGDVDFFFRNSLDSERAVNGLMRLKHEWTDRTLGGYGQEFIIDDTLIQLIQRIEGAPEDVTSNFDLANAKVWLDGEGLHWNDEWMELEERGHLGIDSIDKFNVLWRVSKWMHKHGYDDLRSGDHSMWVDALMYAARKSKTEKWKRFDRDVSLHNILIKGKGMMHLLPPADLLRASMLYDGYDKVTIMKRLFEAGGLLEKKPYTYSDPF